MPHKYQNKSDWDSVVGIASCPGMASRRGQEFPCQARSPPSVRGIKRAECGADNPPPSSAGFRMG
jgi:hypothetical protein